MTKEAITIYRIENPKTHNGMWYDKDGNLAPFIFNLTEGISKHLPMSYNADHYLDGFVWNSAGRSKEQMHQWFSAMDAFELLNNGYKLYEFDVVMYQQKEHEVLFTREGIIKSTEIPLEEIWNFEPLKK